MRDDGPIARAKRAVRSAQIWWIVTDARGENPAALCQLLPPQTNVMRTFAIAERPDLQRQSWDKATKVLTDCTEKNEQCRHRAVLSRLSDPARVAIYTRKEQEARAVLDGTGTVEPFVLTAEAEARGISVPQLAALVAQRAEQDREALAKAWGWQEAERVRGAKI